ncbi:hypothetical protein F4805DRAFT_473407 [Annulohypoxylon moriforme]|nr:hypothetical protein F4805DRAFT_473407 [Annulohypoxylon moriforme]
MKNFSNAITISEDLSHSDKLEERNLLAIKDRKHRKHRKHREHREHRSPRWATTYYPAPKNKKSLMMTGQEEDSESSDSSSDTQTPVATNKKPELLNATRTTQKRSFMEFQSGSNPVEFETSASDLGLTELQSYIARLEKRAKQLEGSTSKFEQTYRFQVLYRINDQSGAPDESTYFDKPEWLDDQHQMVALRSRDPVKNFDLFLERNKEISFLVYRTYVVSTPVPKTPSELTVLETIRPIHEDLISAVSAVLGSKEEYAEDGKAFRRTLQLHAPYLFVFHQRNERDLIQSSLSEACQQHMRILWDYIIQECGHEYTAADDCLLRGMVTTKYVNYMFKPGETLVQRNGDQYIGWVAKSWAIPVAYPELIERNATYGTKREFVTPTSNPQSILRQRRNDKVIMQEWEIDVWNWAFDGKFQPKGRVLKFSAPVLADARDAASASEVALGEYSIPITDLEVFPISHAPKELFDRLQRRGQIFWRCRNRWLVSYRDSDNGNNSVDERYMIDLKTYRSLYDKNRILEHKGMILKELDEETMSKDEPPDGDFKLLLPPTIKGFNLRKKKWFDLNVDRVEEVTWNKDVFEKVVLDSDSKDLIRALVSNMLATEKNTDLIEGKGNGLILLLHGSPGTGKTLTAESVAEMTGKPLYRVTCGDIGTKAEHAEKYLDSVLHLGRLWGCVVLMDEADVFLERRSIEDLDRNALVSVFLRVLEYYEGILILTSNRVHIFDEAFKSRIQLALYYPELGPSQRRRIWKNFLGRLKEINDDSVDLDDLQDHLEDLKDVKMNGREIRNTITTARQYAKWQKKPLTYRQLEVSIRVFQRFDEHIKKSRENSDDWMGAE